MLDDIINHLNQNEGTCLLAKIYGVFSLKTNIFSQVDVIVMQNTIQLKKKKNDKMVFDLKGSSVNRYIKLPREEKKFWKSTFSQKRVMKDINFLEIEKDLCNNLIKI